MLINVDILDMTLTSKVIRLYSAVLLPVITDGRGWQFTRIDGRKTDSSRVERAGWKYQEITPKFRMGSMITLGVDEIRMQ